MLTAGRPNGSPLGVPPDKPLSPRARERLRLAAGLLRASGVHVDDDAGGFHAGVLSALDSLPGDDRERVRGQVDWVEACCNAEVVFFGGAARK